MNIFITDTDPRTAARNLCDRHVPKMLLESAQMLINGLHRYGYSSVAPYRPLMVHHPCSKWAVASRCNYRWLLDHADGIAEEYTSRYKRTHACEPMVSLCRSYLDRMRFPLEDLTRFAQAVPLIYRVEDVVVSYRSYYKADKTFARWDKGTPAPEWYCTHKVVYSEEGVRNYESRGIIVESVL